MTERRLRVAALPEAGGVVPLSKEAVKHARVLRLREGDEVVLFDGVGLRARARITSLGEDAACLSEASCAVAVSRPELHLVLALPKLPTLEDVVRATTELGVTSIHLAISARSVPRLDDARGDRRRERLARIAEEAARQSERDDVPTIAAPRPLSAVTAEVPRDASRLVLCGRSGGPLAPELVTPVWLVVGPEGGLAEEEVRGLVDHGWTAVTLGETVLRVATAATASVAIAMARSRR